MTADRELYTFKSAPRAREFIDDEHLVLVSPREFETFHARDDGFLNAVQAGPAGPDEVTFHERGRRLARSLAPLWHVASSASGCWWSDLVSTRQENFPPIVDLAGRLRAQQEAWRKDHRYAVARLEPDWRDACRAIVASGTTGIPRICELIRQRYGSRED